jgi:4'-phosphopantetheinyl transferase
LRRCFFAGLESVRSEKRERIKKFKFREDAMRGLQGELLLKHALENIYGVNYGEGIIREDEFGKPGLTNKKLFFNISHSGNWAVLACNSSGVGVDVEHVVNPPYEIMNGNFNACEAEQIESGDENIKAVNFFRMWTLKESYVKMLGSGLSTPLLSFCIMGSKSGNIRVADDNRNTENVTFRIFRPDNEYIGAVCLVNPPAEITSNFLNSYELFQ